MIEKNNNWPQFRVGCGYDVHKLAADRKLILCGVEIPYESGLLGHSDADVALHALMDALLGAAGLGDIGRHFPDTDMKFKDADSMLLLRQVVGLLQKHGWQINNADVTIMAQRPKLAPYIEQMAANIAREMRIERSQCKSNDNREIRFCWTGRRDGVRGCCKYYQRMM
jgi:2-C-methyl-D-erythritol 2,4-cyclodiphosphate synthase